MLDEPRLPPAPAPGLWESWGRGRLLALAALLVMGNFACQIFWYSRGGGLFAPVLFGAVGGVILPLLVLGRRWRWRPARDFGLDRPTPVAAAGAVLMALAALAPGSLLAHLSQRLHPVDAEWLTHYTQNLPRSPGDIAIAIAAVVVAGPLAEELIFRGLVHRVFSRTWGPWPAIVASALVFGLVHGEPWYLLGLVAVGAMLAFVWETTRSLTACWLAHAVHNGVSLGVMVAEGPAGAQPQAPTPVDLAVAAASLAMLVLVGRWLRRAAAR
jgi:membrane protease YdiL (CAAX protease family)